MSDFLELLKQFLPVEIAVIALIFVYLLLLFKGIAEKFVAIAEKQAELAETQATYIQQRLEVVERTVGISEKTIGMSDRAFDLQEKEIQKLKTLLNQLEGQTAQAKAAEIAAERKLGQVQERYELALAKMGLQSQQIEELQAAQRELEVALLDREMTGFAHEFQTRLQGLLAYAEYLRSNVESGVASPQEMLNDASEISYGILKLNVLTQNLSLGLGDYRFERVDLRTIVDQSVSLYQSEARRKNVSFLLNFSEPALIDVSPNHIHQAINNLISNAVRYSYTGSSSEMRQIRIGGTNLEGAYELAVENYGVGILPDELEMVFQKYYRGRLALDERRTGAGLGLAIANEIVKTHGGTIKVTSRQVDSAYLTSFIVRLPITQSRGEKHGQDDSLD